MNSPNCGHPAGFHCVPVYGGQPDPVDGYQSGRHRDRLRPFKQLWRKRMRVSQLMHPASGQKIANRGHSVPCIDKKKRCRALGAVALDIVSKLKI
jgi:hypothetical protein